MKKHRHKCLKCRKYFPCTHKTTDPDAMEQCPNEKWSICEACFEKIAEEGRKKAQEAL